MLRDLRLGLRLLARSPFFALAALTVMALGVGATTAVFTVVRGVLLRDLPYRQPDRLVLFRAALPGDARQPLLTPDEWLALRDRSDLFESVAVVNETQANLTAPDDMETVAAAAISDNFFDTLGVHPALGRFVTHQDISRGVRAVTISDALWRKHFQADPGIVGRTIQVDNRPVTVAGVLPAGFRLYLGPGVHVSSEPDVIVPRVRGWDDDPARTNVVIARLRPAIALGSAQAAVETTIARVMAATPERYRAGAVRMSLATLDREVVSDVKPALVALSGAVAFVLLVACANLMNLLLARASARAREIALRTSIGASPFRIVRQLVAEGLVIGGLGAAAGLVLAHWGVTGLLELAPATLPRLEAVTVDTGIAAFAVATAMVCAIVVSAVPAWQATAASSATTLRQVVTASSRARLTRGLLLAGQVALSLTLLAGAGLMARAFINLRLVPLGFDAHGALTMRVSLSGDRFNGANLADDRARRLVFYHQLVDSARQVAGVEQVGVGLPAPLAGPPLTQRVALEPGGAEHPTEGGIALAGYLETLRVPLTAGRYFAPSDDQQPVAIVDERLAAQLFTGPALGRRILVKTAISEQWDEVVGVVRHVQMRGLRGDDLPQIWMTYGTRSYSGLTVVVRGANPSALIEPMRQAIQRLGPGRPVQAVRALDDYVADASADTRFALFVLGVFAAVAVVLSGLGIYGVVAYATARRTREIAVRLALGAQPQAIIRLVLRDGLPWAFAGLVAGLAGAVVLTRYLDSLLFGVGATDPATFAAVSALLAVIAVVATAVPALRAVRVDPMAALKSE